MKAHHVLISVLSGVAALGGDAPFELSRYSIDGGGVMRSTGGEFELSGTIGQPDAGVMAGGDFNLTGGFWFALSPTDCNEDGVADLLDYDSFTQCMGGPDGGVSAGCPCFDVDQNGSVDLRDFATAQVVFSRSGPD